jgi:hypothetical protein
LEKELIFLCIQDLTDIFDLYAYFIIDNKLKMTKIQGLFTIMTILEIGLLVMTSLKGAIYDGLKEDIDKKYTDNHSFSLKYGRFRFSIPRFINEKTENKELIAAAKIYNRYSLFFWTNLVLLIIIYNIAY